MVKASDQVRERIEALETLPTVPRIAIRFVELGKDPEADVEDYVRLVQSDASLSTKLLAVANSPFFATRHRITSVKKAVGHLGMTNVRALAVSYCLAGLHNVWKLNPRDREAYWGASLTKAVAARLAADTSDRELAEHIFVSALFQDIGLGLLVSVGGREFAERLGAPDLTVEDQLREEAACFGLNHAQAGELVGQKLGVPEDYLRIIASHHDAERLDAGGVAGPTIRATRIAALLPHDLRCWKPADVGALNELMREDPSGRWPEAEAFIAAVQNEFEKLVNMLGSGGDPPSLIDLMREACAENARVTTMLVGQVRTLVNHNSDLLGSIAELNDRASEAERRAELNDKLVNLNQELVRQSRTDSLTGLLNRRAWEESVALVDQRFRENGEPYSVVMIDVDYFKAFNDALGHQCGDDCLRKVANGILAGARSRTDLVARYGGEEFVVLVSGATLGPAAKLGERIRRTIEELGIVHPESPGGDILTVSVGVAEGGPGSWEDAVHRADAALYAAKRAGRNRVRTDASEHEVIRTRVER